MELIYEEKLLELTTETEERMEKTLSVLKSDFANMRAGRANPHILDRISVDYYGTLTPLAQMSNITVTDAKCLTISVWDASMLKAVEKAILEANIGINPTNDGKVIRLVFPDLTEERRRDLVKQVKKGGEEAKVAVRNIRRDAMDTLKKMKTAKHITEDEAADYEKDIEKLTVKFVEAIDNTVKDKEKELMSV